MSTLILIRHGETDWNRDRIFRGRADIPLGERGKQQAERTGEALKDRRLEAIYTSPLLRSAQTAEAIARRQEAEITEVDDITDIDYGDWQGKALKDVMEQYPEVCALWESAPHEARIPGGECLGELSDRSSPAVQRLVGSHRGKIAVVSHRVVLKVVILGLLGLGVESFWNLRLDTCGITIFEILEGRNVLISFNDVSHLTGLRDEASADF